MAELITQAEYARRRGVSREAVGKAVRSNRITLIGDKIDPVVADIQWDKNTNPDQSARANAQKDKSGSVSGSDESAGDRASPYWDARTRREVAEAEMAEMECRKKSGELVDKKRVEDTASRIGRLTRDTLMGIPTRVSQDIVGMSDAWEIEQKLTDSIRRALDDVAKISDADLAKAIG
ncbi:MAG: hypothetical protein ABIG70_03045 [Pseudomonadota bacterium]